MLKKGLPFSDVRAVGAGVLGAIGDAIRGAVSMVGSRAAPVVVRGASCVSASVSASRTAAFAVFGAAGSPVAVRLALGGVVAAMVISLGAGLAALTLSGAAAQQQSRPGLLDDEPVEAATETGPALGADLVDVLGAGADQSGGQDPSALDQDGIILDQLGAAGEQDLLEAQDTREWLRGRRATLRGLDKVTALTRDFDVQLNEPTQFGSLTITMATPCAKLPPQETPETWVGLEIGEPETDGRGRELGKRTLFRGWMLAQSPALSPLDHRVYDIWPLDCHVHGDDAAPSVNLRPGE